METILAQTIMDWELIVCDSHSDDGAWEFFQQFKSDPRIRLEQVPRAGIYAGFNECLRRATGKYCYIATSDDTASPNLLEKMVAPLERFPEVKLAFCDYERIDEQSRPLPPLPRDWRREFLGEWLHVPSIHNGQTEFLLHCAFNTIWVTMTSVLFRRGLLDQIGYFPTEFKSLGDLAWTLRASLATDIAFVPGRLATWRIHPEQASPALLDWKYYHAFLQMFKSVIYDPTLAVPKKWTCVPNWDRELITLWKREYYEGFHLAGWFAKRHPGVFFNNIWAALRVEPWFLMSQTLRGFGSSIHSDTNPIHTANRLFELFKPSWPPRRISV